MCVCVRVCVRACMCVCVGGGGGVIIIIHDHLWMNRNFDLVGFYKLGMTRNIKLL